MYNANLFRKHVMMLSVSDATEPGTGMAYLRTLGNGKIFLQNYIEAFLLLLVDYNEFLNEN